MTIQEKKRICPVGSLAIINSSWGDPEHLGIDVVGKTAIVADYVAGTYVVLQLPFEVRKVNSHEITTRVAIHCDRISPSLKDNEEALILLKREVA